jgi:predicted alpha/beta superfamily hydrolase
VSRAPMKPGACTAVALIALLRVSQPLAGQTADRIPAHASFVVHSHFLAEDRTINVYSPPVRAPGDTVLPVLYMLDGGLAEDFPHVVNTIDSLIRLGRLARVMVVGIENTQRRRDLTGPTAVASDSAIAPRVGGSAAFRAFIRDELMPEVHARYGSSEETAIVGESLAGLFIVETALFEPTLFRRYIALSPSVWWNGGELVRIAPQRATTLPPDRVLYLSAANEAQIADGTASIAAAIRAAAPGVALYYQPRPDLEHSTIFRAVAPEAFARTLWQATYASPASAAPRGRVEAVGDGGKAPPAGHVGGSLAIAGQAAGVGTGRQESHRRLH